MICEGMGFESGLNKRLSQATVFYSIYTVLTLLFGAGVVLSPHILLIKLILLSHVVNSYTVPISSYQLINLPNPIWFSKTLRMNSDSLAMP